MNYNNIVSINGLLFNVSLLCTLFYSLSRSYFNAVASICSLYICYSLLDSKDFDTIIKLLEMIFMISAVVVIKNNINKFSTGVHRYLVFQFFISVLLFISKEIYLSQYSQIGYYILSLTLIGQIILFSPSSSTLIFKGAGIMLLPLMYLFFISSSLLLLSITTDYKDIVFFVLMGLSLFFLSSSALFEHRIKKILSDLMSGVVFLVLIFSSFISKKSYLSSVTLISLLQISIIASIVLVIYITASKPRAISQKVLFLFRGIGVPIMISAYVCIFLTIFLPRSPVSRIIFWQNYNGGICKNIVLFVGRFAVLSSFIRLTYLSILDLRKPSCKVYIGEDNIRATISKLFILLLSLMLLFMIVLSKKGLIKLNISDISNIGISFMIGFFISYFVGKFLTLLMYFSKIGNPLRLFVVLYTIIKKFVSEIVSIIKKKFNRQMTYLNYANVSVYRDPVFSVLLTLVVFIILRIF